MANLLLTPAKVQGFGHSIVVIRGEVLMRTPIPAITKIKINGVLFELHIIIDL
jgi:hypothetical protein